MAQQAIDNASATYSVEFGRPTANAIFKEALKNTLKVRAQLNPQSRKRVELSVDVPLVFENTEPVTHDHPELYAFREVVRAMYHRSSNIAQTSVKTLAIGSSNREMSMYIGNHYIDHYFHLGEGKDIVRTCVPLLDKMAKSIKKRTSKTNRKVFYGNKGTKLEFAAKYTDTQKLFDDFSVYNGLPKKFYTKFPDKKYEMLIFEDSIYNFDKEMLHDVFRKTGAKVAYGYFLLPQEFSFPDLPASDLYDLETVGDRTELTYRWGSHTNGYSHKTKAWRTLLDNIIIPGKGFSIGVEIVSRAGPMVCFSLHRITCSDNWVRTISLREMDQYVRILDIYNSVDLNTGKLLEEKKYVSFYSEEYFEALNYLLAIDPKSLTFTNAMTYVRRRSGGMSLVNKELLAPWRMKKSELFKFAYGVFLQAKVIQNYEGKIEKEMDIGSKTKKFKDFLERQLKDTMGMLFYWAFPVVCLIDALTKANLIGEIVLYPDDRYRQRAEVVYKNPLPLEYSLEFHETNEDDDIQCPICFSLKDGIGLQLVKCEHKDKACNLEMTDTQINEMLNTLIDTDLDPTKLAEVKDRAKENLPKFGFVHKLRVHYICGGPGTGKSYITKALADSSDLIYLPFFKLQSDYAKAKNPDGSEKNLYTVTTHRGIKPGNHKAMYCDEFTSMPYEYIAAACFLNNVEDLYLVGDEKQTKVNGVEEGTYIGDVIDLSTIGKHTLLRNFRNSEDTVQLLNHYHGYDMQAMSTVKKSIKVLGPNDPLVDLSGQAVEKSQYVQMAFSHATCHQENLTVKNSVRSNQGGSYPKVILYVGNNDAARINDEDHRIVAISRHTEELLIIHDDSTPARNFLNMYGDFETDNIPKPPAHQNAAPDIKGDDVFANQFFKDYTPAVPAEEYQPADIPSNPTFLYDHVPDDHEYYCPLNIEKEKMTPGVYALGCQCIDAFVYNPEYLEVYDAYHGADDDDDASSQLSDQSSVFDFSGRSTPVSNYLTSDSDSEDDDDENDDGAGVFANNSANIGNDNDSVHGDNVSFRGGPPPSDAISIRSIPTTVYDGDADSDIADGDYQRPLVMNNRNFSFSTTSFFTNDSSSTEQSNRVLDDILFNDNNSNNDVRETNEEIIATNHFEDPVPLTTSTVPENYLHEDVQTSIPFVPKTESSDESDY